jgi:2-polyprenyl-3-methyl-5-hydroxy-6-metoxy-1,4-benzoquinol methylase
MKWEEIEYFFSSYHEDLVWKKICDIWCGSGRLLEQEHISPDNYVWVDSSKELLRIAEWKFEGYNFVHKNMQQIDDIWKNDFDSLLFIASFHHLKTLEERIQVLERSRSILQKNGKIFMINWSLQSNININKYKESMILDSKNDFYSCDFDIKIWEHKRFYHSFSLSELEYLFHKTGFEIIENREFENQRNIISIIKKSWD